jgi:hypothetical protein
MAAAGMKKGSHHTSEARAEMSAAKKGNQYALGRKHSPEAIAKMKGRKVSPEARAKIGAAQAGKVVSAETRAKISAALMGHTNGRGPNYRANKLYCARVYKAAWGQIPYDDSVGRAYVVHHRDGNRQNDDPENFIALTISEHMTLEHALKRGDFDLSAAIDAIGESRRQT